MEVSRFEVFTRNARASAQEKLLALGKRPLIMGVLNVTPDSFSDGGKFFDVEQAVARGMEMAREGADIIDIGGESTRPGAKPVALEEELSRVMPVIDCLVGSVGVPISIDTRKAAVAEKACSAGAMMINDVSGLVHDPGMASVAARYGAYLVIMHMRGTPETMQNDTHYDDLIGEIRDFLASAAAFAVSCGVDRSKIIIDPGLGFGKSVEQNFVILRRLRELQPLGFPLMIGASRKSFIGKSLDLPVNDRLEGSLAAAIFAVLQGAAIVRVHDVKQTWRALKIIDLIVRSG